MKKNPLRQHSLKLFALIFSIFLWINVLTSEKVQIEKRVQINYILPRHIIFSERPPQNVLVTIKGSRLLTQLLSQEKKSVNVDLSGLELKENSILHVELHPKDFKFPSGLKTEKIIPQKFTLSLGLKEGSS